MNKDLSNIRFNAIQSAPDSRDFKPEDILGSSPTTLIPDSYVTDISMVPVYNQLLEDSCAGNGEVDLYSALARISDNLSFRFGYDTAHKIMGDTQLGTTGRATMQALKRYGLPLATFYPNDTTLTPEQFVQWNNIPVGAYTDAANRRSANYAQLTDLSFEGIKQSIFQHKAVALLVKMRKDWWTASDGTVTWNGAQLFPLRQKYPVNGAHFIVAYGYTANGILFRNSWSSEWGVGGNGDFDSSYPDIIEAWVASLPIPPAPVLPNNPTIQQDKSWLSALVVWLKNLLNLTSVSIK